MLKKTPSQDSNFDEFRRIWMEMDRIDPLTPLPLWDPDNYRNEDE